MSRHWVLVYGTLKSTERNHHFMEDCLFAGWEKTAMPDFLMQQFESATSKGKFTPGVQKVETHGGRIEGELYIVTDKTMIQLDILEGVGTKYDREEVMLKGGMKAWMYLRRGDGGVLPSRHIDFDKSDNVYSWSEKPAP